MPYGVHQMNEPFVNQQLMERVLRIKEKAEDSRLILETVSITDLWNKAVRMTEDELIVCTIAALQVCPDKVYAALADDREELLRKGKANERRKDD